MQNPITTPNEDQQKLFTELFDAMSGAAHSYSKKNGFWEEFDAMLAMMPTSAFKARLTAMMVAEKLDLMHSELSEALEGVRDGNPASEKLGDQGYSQMEEELADCVIRIMDLAGQQGMKIGPAILAKMRYNYNRPYKHGRVS